MTKSIQGQTFVHVGNLFDMFYVVGQWLTKDLLSWGCNTLQLPLHLLLWMPYPL